METSRYQIGIRIFPDFGGCHPGLGAAERDAAEDDSDEKFDRSEKMPGDCRARSPASPEHVPGLVKPLVCGSIVVSSQNYIFASAFQAAAVDVGQLIEPLSGGIDLNLAGIVGTLEDRQADTVIIIPVAVAVEIAEEVSVFVPVQDTFIENRVDHDVDIVFFRERSCLGSQLFDLSGSQDIGVIDDPGGGFIVEALKGVF